MKRKKIRLLAMSLGFAAVVLLLGSCSAVKEQIGTLTGGKVTSKDVETAEKVTKAVRNSFADITEEEEYYIGRAVSAMILSRYPVYENAALTEYVNQVGNAVAIYSDRPETYAGYHFLILDTEEVNAMAAPGGFIFITKGLLKRCPDEESLGCILAHEVGHVSAKHGLQSIKKSRLLDAFSIIGQEAVQRYGPEKLGQLTDIFENVLGDIAGSLIEKGYDRKYEYEADRLSVKTANLTGYNADGLLEFLATMVGDHSAESGLGWFKTHPSAEDRIERVKKELSTLKSMPPTDAERTARFQKAIKTLT
jgi:predicted Zn-dependent protease